MAIRNYRVIVTILVLLALVIGIVWSFAKGQFYTGSDIFWYGAIAGPDVLSTFRLKAN